MKIRNAAAIAGVVSATAVVVFLYLSDPFNEMLNSR